MKSLLGVKSDRGALVRTAYMACDLRFQAIDLLTERYGLDETLSFVLELGGLLLTRADLDESKVLNLTPVLKRTLGKDWKEIFDVVGTVAFRVATWKQWMDAEEDVRLFLKSGRLTRAEKSRAARVREVAQYAGVA